MRGRAEECVARIEAELLTVKQDKERKETAHISTGESVD